MRACSDAAAMCGRGDIAGTDLLRINNFDLIRLGAACQVALSHGLSHLDVSSPDGLDWLSYFPGVPIFFFVSGFLISRSYEGAGSLGDYSRNRLLRIYPALIVCTAVSLLMLLATGYLDLSSVGSGATAIWFMGQITVFQFYNPDFLRGFGAGVINGSLWTIAVELQFYVLVPLIYWLLGRFARSPRRFDAALAAMALLFLAANVAYFSIDRTHWDTLGRKLLGVSFVPWLYMFLLGVIAQRKFDVLHGLLASRAPAAVATYVLACVLAVRPGLFQSGNGISPPLFLLLTAAVLACAYSAPRLSGALLGRNDVSYGIYIYHMPIINLFIFLGIVGQPEYLILALGMVGVLAILSWRLVERPALAMKSHPFFPVAATEGCSSKGTT